LGLSSELARLNRFSGARPAAAAAGICDLHHSLIAPRPTYCPDCGHLYGGIRPCAIRIGRGETRTTIGTRTSTDGPRPAG